MENTPSRENESDQRDYSVCNHGDQGKLLVVMIDTAGQDERQERQEYDQSDDRGQALAGELGFAQEGVGIG